jgi:glycerol-3-phosphate acyltransferase PlsY
MKELLIILSAYLIGSLPTAVWVSRYFFNIDIREYGSGNAGATNTFRVLGKKWGTFVMIADMLKGLAAVKLVWLLPYYFDHDLARTSLQIGLGLVLGISPWSALCCSGVFLLVLFLTRFVSLSSILASAAFPIFILVIFNVDNHPYRIFAVGVALLVILTHQKNISRLLKGNESKVPILKHRDRRRQRRLGTK